MYHIKNDKRAKKSAKLICSALEKLMQNKEYKDITISDIQQISGVSRSTVYRNFDTTDDILRLMCDRGFDEIFSSRNGLYVSVNCFNYWYDNSSVLEALMKAGHVDYFAQAFNKHLIESNLLRKHLSSEVEYHYFSSLLSYAMVGILTAWIERGRKETKRELMQLVIRSISVVKPAMLIGL